MKTVHDGCGAEFDDYQLSELWIIVKDGRIVKYSEELKGEIDKIARENGLEVGE